MNSGLLFSIPVIEASVKAGAESISVWGYAAPVIMLSILLFLSALLRLRNSYGKTPGCETLGKVVVLSSTIVGRNQRLLSINWKGREMLVAVADSNVTLLATHENSLPHFGPNAQLNMEKGEPWI